MKSIRLFIGKDNSSKKALFFQAVDELSVSVDGIMTEKIGEDEKEPAPCYIHACKGPRTYSEENKIGICQNRKSIKIPAVFDTFGVNLLNEAKKAKVIAIYEIGTMENRAEIYQKAVLELMDDEEHDMIIGVRDKDTEFINRVINHKNVTERVYCAD